jgi:hypothetical protein
MAFKIFKGRDRSVPHLVLPLSKNGLNVHIEKNDLEGFSSWEYGIN